MEDSLILSDVNPSFTSTTPSTIEENFPDGFFIDLELIVKNLELADQIIKNKNNNEFIINNSINTSNDNKDEILEIPTTTISNFEISTTTISNFDITTTNEYSFNYSPDESFQSNQTKTLTNNINTNQYFFEIFNQTINDYRIYFILLTILTFFLILLVILIMCYNYYLSKKISKTLRQKNSAKMSKKKKMPSFDILDNGYRFNRNSMNIFNRSESNDTHMVIDHDYQFENFSNMSRTFDKISNENVYELPYGELINKNNDSPKTNDNNDAEKNTNNQYYKFKTFTSSKRQDNSKQNSNSDLAKDVVIQFNHRNSLKCDLINSDNNSSNKNDLVDNKPIYASNQFKPNPVANNLTMKSFDSSEYRKSLVERSSLKHDYIGKNSFIYDNKTINEYSTSGDDFDEEYDEEEEKRKEKNEDDKTCEYYSNQYNLMKLKRPTSLQPTLISICLENNNSPKLIPNRNSAFYKPNKFRNYENV